MNSTAMRQKDIRPAAAEIEHKGFKFLITDRPSDQTIHVYIQVSPATLAPYQSKSNRKFPGAEKAQSYGGSQGMPTFL